MKRMMKPLVAACIVAFAFSACQKDATETVQKNDVSTETLSKIKALGFDETDARKVDRGYLVEGDIILTDENLNKPAISPYLNVANEEQYRTTNLVSVGGGRTITVTCSGTLTPVYVTATKAMIDRYNAIASPTVTNGTLIKFQYVTSGPADVNVIGFNEGPSGGFITLGSSGFPTNGNPYDEIQMNTNVQAYGTNPNVDYLTSVLQHEMGHCIGFRHTDYFSRSSCGKRKQNEGTAGVGAILIPGTPSTADPNSFMLACSNGGNRTFNANDLVAMNYLY